MTEAQTLAEQYSLKEKEEKADAVTEPGEVKNVDNPGNAAPEEVVSKKAEQTSSAVAEEVAKVADAPPEGSEPTPADNDENIEANPSATENSNEAATENTSENAENSDDRAVAEETPEIKLETAPVDFRFPTTNQSRHCFTRYIEYHRCIAAKGEGAPECDRFAKYYRALCPGEWVRILDYSSACRKCSLLADLLLFSDVGSLSVAHWLSVFYMHNGLLQVKIEAFFCPRYVQT